MVHNVHPVNSTMVYYTSFSIVFTSLLNLHCSIPPNYLHLILASCSCQGLRKRLPGDLEVPFRCPPSGSSGKLTTENLNPPALITSAPLASRTKFDLRGKSILPSRLSVSIALVKTPSTIYEACHSHDRCFKHSGIRTVIREHEG